VHVVEGVVAVDELDPLPGACADDARLEDAVALIDDDRRLRQREDAVFEPAGDASGPVASIVASSFPFCTA